MEKRYTIPGPFWSQSHPPTLPAGKPFTSYRFDLTFAKAIAGKDWTWEVVAGQQVLQRRVLSPGDVTKFVMFRTGDGSAPLAIRIVNADGKPLDVQLASALLIEIDFFSEPSRFTFTENSVVACLATYPPREDMLKDSINSLMGQVDHIFVYMNAYSHVPDFIQHMAEVDALSYVIASENRLRAAGKFFWADCGGYILLCDDDIIYPPDYRVRMVKEINRYDRQAVVGLHGKRFVANEQGKTLISEQFKFPTRLSRPRQVNLLGTGVAGFHSSALHRIDKQRLFERPIDNDEVLAVECRLKGIPMYCIPREAGWVVSNPKMLYGINEEVAVDRAKFTARQNFLGTGSPWPDYRQDLEQQAPAPQSNQELLEIFKHTVRKRHAQTPMSLVQIGACDGVAYDPVHSLINELNLRATFFEPLGHLFTRLQQNYAGKDNAVFINAAVAETSGLATLRYVEPQAIDDGVVPDWSIGIGTLLKDVNAVDGAKIPKEMHEQIAPHIREQTVSVLSFEAFAQWNGVADADIFVSDAEGYDLYFLSCIADGLISPLLVLSEVALEHRSKVAAVMERLRVRGYTVCRWTEFLLASLLPLEAPPGQPALEPRVNNPEEEKAEAAEAAKDGASERDASSASAPEQSPGA